MTAIMARVTQFKFFSGLHCFSALHCFLALQLLTMSHWAVSAVVVQDDAGNTLQLLQPAARVISLAPHLTENMFAIGSGSKLLAVSRFSDFPAQAKSLPSVGDYQSIDTEAILALQPDLILAWVDGGNYAAVNQLQDFGLPIYWSRPATLESIANELHNLSILTGAGVTGEQASEVFSAQLKALSQFQHRAPVAVFYQVWQQPLQTLNGQTLISDIIRHCGGVNLFANAPAVVMEVSVEAVIAARPDVILGSHAKGEDPSWVEAWRRWPTINAVRNNQLYSLNADTISRNTPRALLGARQVCDYLQNSRSP